MVELWSFLHGDIMEGAIRQLLRAGLGLCPRHTWGYAAAEIELWQTGAGVRGGHQPFDVSVLYEDLLDHVAGRLRKRAGLFHHDLRHVLIPREECRICNVVRPAGTPGGAGGATVGYAGASAVDLARETNRLTYTTAWCRETRPRWQSGVCPHCAALFTATPEQVQTGSEPVRCRRHLLNLPLTPESASTVAVHLEDVAGRLRRLGTSMTMGGSAATADDDASWVQALGWFAGWRVPLTLAGDACT